MSLIPLTLPIASITAIITYLIINSPWLVNKGQVIRESTIRDGAVMVISDLHIEDNPADLTVIGGLVRAGGVKVLVVAGDLFNRGMRVTDSGFRAMVKYAVDRMGLGGISGLTVIHVMSLTAHDLRLSDGYGVRVVKVNDVTFIAVPWVIRIKFPNCGGAVYVTHGDYAVKDGALAGLINLVSLKLFNYPVIEVMLRRLLNVGDGDWVISGHTHIKLINDGLRVANPGSWIKALIVKPSRGYVLIRCVNSRLDVRLGTQNPQPLQ